MKIYSKQTLQLFSYYEKRGEEAYFGEEVNQLQHAVQAAKLAAEQYPSDKEFIIAAFFHDIGHICQLSEATAQQMGKLGVANHEQIGAILLSETGLPSKIVNLVNGHVEAKRYLVSTDREYYATLSEASKGTLNFQGGKMTAEEIQAFQQEPLFELHIALRRIDDQAKIQNQEVGSISWIMEMLEELMTPTLP
jgi:predicted HD phosphohydrolase